MVFQAIHDFPASEGGSAMGLANAPGGTFYGGTFGSFLANGSLFQMDASGTLTTLHAFAGPEGYGVNGAPLLASDGNLYGVTDHTVFRWTPAGDMVVLHDFSASGDRCSLLRSGSWRRRTALSTAPSTWIRRLRERSCGSTLPATCRSSTSFRARMAWGRGELCSTRATGTCTARRKWAARSGAASFTASTRPRPCRS